MITFSLCLSDIPKEKITTSEKNGKKYLSLVMWENKDGEDKFGNTHSITVSKPQGDTSPNLYLGNGKQRGLATTQAPKQDAKTPEEDNDLPF